MSAIAGFAEAELDRLRRTHYNARLAKIIEVHEDLRILRVVPDQGVPSFLPGQYCVLGLGNWEPRVAGCQEDFLEPSQLGKLLKRAYSFSCPMLDDAGNLLPVDRCDFLEFYVVLVRDGREHPPGLTPRLFGLGEGTALFVGSKTTGHYTLREVKPTDQVIFVATGTGERRTMPWWPTCCRANTRVRSSA
jgi:ferredoxin--NADP+ reductase